MHLTNKIIYNFRIKICFHEFFFSLDKSNDSGDFLLIPLHVLLSAFYLQSQLPIQFKGGGNPI